MRIDSMQKVAPLTVNDSDGRFSMTDGTFWLSNWTHNRASQSRLGLGTADRAPNRAPQLLHMIRTSKGALSLADGLPSSDMDLVDDPSPKYPLSNAPFRLHLLQEVGESIDCQSQRTTNTNGAEFRMYCARSELRLSSASRWICTNCCDEIVLLDSIFTCEGRGLQ